MDNLLEKSSIDERKLHRFIKTISTQELSNLSEPCYYPQLRKYKSELLRMIDLKEKDFKEFPKRFYKGTKWEKFQLHNDDYSNLLLFIMYYFLKNNNSNGFSSTMLLYNIRQYSNVLHRSLKYCNVEVFKYALDNLSNNHLFKRERTIGNAIYYLSKHYVKFYEKSILNKNVDNIGKFIQESRHRINQSIKSFATIYYDAHEKHEAYKKPQEFDGEEIEVPIERGITLIDKFVKRIIVYRQLDKKTFEESLKLSTVKKDKLIEDILKELSNNKYNENLKMIYRILLNRMKDLDIICSDKFNDEVKRLMTLKRSKGKVYFKQQINVLLIELLKSTKNYSKYQKMNKRNQFFLNLFFAYYLSLSFRNYICF